MLDWSCYWYSLLGDLPLFVYIKSYTRFESINQLLLSSKKEKIYNITNMNKAI